MKNYEYAGTWWNDRNTELVKIDGKIYALSGWNGEQYNNCWECGGDFNMDVLKENITIRPINVEIDGEYEIESYKVM